MKYYVQGTRKFRFEGEINASSSKDVERKINAMSLEDLKEWGDEDGTGPLGDSLEIVRSSDKKTWSIF